MKRILVLIIVLLTAIVSMAYLYFTGLNADKKNNDYALYSAAVNSAFIFAFENDKSVLDILGGKSLLKDLIGEKKSAELQSLHTFLLGKVALNQLTDKQNIYIGLVPAADKTIDFLYTTELSAGADRTLLLSALKSSGISSRDTLKNIVKLGLPDSSTFFLAVRDQVVFLSGTATTIEQALLRNPEKSGKFAEYILSSSRLSKSSLAEIYINYQTLPELLKAAIPGKLNGELGVFSDKDAFAILVYNYSTEKILFNGATKINDQKSYFQLYATFEAQKVTISNILPENTASYTAYTISNYPLWKKALDQWFKDRGETSKTAAVTQNISNKYRLDPEQLFPKYFKNQLLTFQLSTGEKLAAIDLSNGEKLAQLLIDLSVSYNDDIKVFKDAELLYSYFGEPLRNFKRPFYVIMDNYLIMANNASTLQSFLNSYKRDDLLINNPDYTRSINQLPNSSAITFYVDLRNAQSILLRNVYLPYYRYLTSKDGLGAYSSFICQLSGERDKFQTNILLNKKADALPQNSLSTGPDSLSILPSQ